MFDWLINFFTTCDFCGKRDNLITIDRYFRVHKTIRMSSTTYHYHKDCLNDVCCNPEEYGAEHEIIKLAKDIIYSTKLKKELREKRDKKKQEDIEYIKNHCVS